MDADGNELSTPDGNATYSWSIVHEAQRRGHRVFAMQEDRDYPAWKRLKAGNFASFSQQKRVSAYEGLKHTRGETFPELDLLLLEWRFPISGRNCERREDGRLVFDPERHQPDLLRQQRLLEHYKQAKTKVVLWDLDHKLEKRDEDRWLPDGVLETSAVPRLLSKARTKVEPPTVVSDLLQHPTLPADPSRKLTYIGSRYERDDVIDEWIKPVAEKYPNQVEFHGKWDAEAKSRWANVSFGPRCTAKDFRRIYGTAGGVPLLAKRGYLETGFATPRIWEAVLFGSIPIGLKGHLGVENYTDWVADDAQALGDMSWQLSQQPLERRDYERRTAAEKLQICDVGHFVDVLEKFA